jgi:hypothetical protein
VIGAVNFAFRLGCTLIGIMVAHAILVAASITDVAFPGLFIGTVVGFTCGWLSKRDG